MWVLVCECDAHARLCRTESCMQLCGLPRHRDLMIARAADRSRAAAPLDQKGLASLQQSYLVQRAREV